MSLARRSLQIVAFICTLIVGVAAMAVIVTQTTWFKEWLRGFIVRQAEDYVNGELSIGRLDGNLFFGVELEDVDVTVNGEKIVEIKDVGLDYNAFTLVGGDVVLDDIRLNQPTLRLERTAEGWNLARLLKVRTPDPEEPPAQRTIEIGEIGVSDGTLYIEDEAVGTSGVNVPGRIEKLNASIGVTSNERALHVDVGHVSLRASEPTLAVNDLSGTVRRTADEILIDKLSLRTAESSLQVNGEILNIESGTPAVDLSVTSDKLALDEIARVVPALSGYEMQPAFELKAEGPADRLAVNLHAREQNLGQVTGDLTVDALEPGRRVAGTLSMEHLNIGPLAKSQTLKSDITGRARVDLTLPADKMPLSGTYAIDASRAAVAGYEVRDLAAKGRIDGDTIRLDASAAAYGGRATAAGTVTTGDPLALDMQGRAVNVDLRNLPPALNAPGVPSDLDVDYQLRGRGKVYSADLQFRSSTLAGATIAPGTTASVTVGGRAPQYSAEGSVRNLDLERIGRGFGLEALAADRFASNLNATFTVRGSGGGSAPLNLDSSATLVDSTLFGASVPRMDVKARLDGEDAQVSAIGQFSGLDPAVASGNEDVKGQVSGAVDVNATLRDYRSGVTPDSVAASGRINLGESSVAGLEIDSAVIDGRYDERAGQLTQLAVAGPDLNVRGQGRLALNETGASDLTVHLDSPSLDRVGKLIGQPLKGSAIVDATITGNAERLQAKGTLEGSNLGYGENEALDIDSQFNVAVPNLEPARAAVDAQTHATFLELGGQQITELTAETTYAEKKLGFNAKAQEGERELQVEGDVVLHPEHQEIHLTNLGLQAADTQWRLGGETAVQYGKDRIDVEDFRLVNENQVISADGTIGAGGEPLRVELKNVDVAQVDQLLLTNRQIAGRLDANAVISGPTDALHVQGDFALRDGAFQEFTFDALTGDVKYGGQGMNVDVRLQQTPEAWLTAEGYVPLALFRADEHTGGTGHDAPPPGEQVDLRVASSRIDLGVIQGFTQAVTNVTGTLQANVQVTGSAHDPHMDGAIDITGGAFSVPEARTSYTGLDTRIELSPDTVSIREMRIVDEHQNPLTIGGTLAVHERAVGQVDIRISSEDFEVIDNELADLKLDTDLRVTGELRAPTLNGTIEVENGTIHVAELLETVAADPYATEATTLEEIKATDGELDPEEPSVFDALEMNVTLAVPSNLVLRGSDIRTPGAPIAIGDMNLTVGGDVQIRKPRNGELRLLGEVNTVRGNYDFQGRRFEIMRDGRIRFAGDDEINPLLDLRARRVISGVEAFVRIQGTMRQPELSFSSNPPLDQADILALIVFNAPLNELGEGQQVSLAQRAGALAGGYLASGLASSIGNALELDQFEIQAQGDAGAGPSLTIGEQVGEKLFVRLRQGFGEAQATEFILEYQIADYLRLQGSVAEVTGGSPRQMFRRVERGGLDLVFFFSY